MPGSPQPWGGPARWPQTWEGQGQGQRGGGGGGVVRAPPYPTFLQRQAGASGSQRGGAQGVAPGAGVHELLARVLVRELRNGCSVLVVDSQPGGGGGGFACQEALHAATAGEERRGRWEGGRAQEETRIGEEWHLEKLQALGSEADDTVAVARAEELHCLGWTEQQEGEEGGGGNEEGREVSVGMGRGHWRDIAAAAATDWKQ